MKKMIKTSLSQSLSFNQHFMRSSSYEIVESISVFVVGVQLIFGVCRWIYGNVIGPKFLQPTNLRQYGSWALVTGASDGIGKQFAISLARHGVNIVLVSRSISKLEGVAQEITQNFNVQTQVIAVDFTLGSEIYKQIKQEIVGKNIGILINNVGMFQPAPDLFLDIPKREKVIQDIVSCNITSVPMMCSLILPQMVQRKRGLIINISSIASVIPGPTMSMYAASKAFVSKFSSDLASEYESQGINVQVLITGGVATNMNKAQGGTFTVPTASQYVESSLSHVGYARWTSGYLPHSLIAIIAQFMNFISPSFVESVVKKHMLGVRELAIKRGSYKPVE